MKEKIFRTCWGYNMTNVEFFQVVKESAKSFWVKEIAQVETSTGFLSGTTVPVPNSFVKDYRTGKEKVSLVRRKKTSDGGESFSISDYPGGYRRYALPWNGKPCYFNHCD